MAGPAVGTVAQDFTLPRSTFKSHTLSSYRDHEVVIVEFLALAFTGGPDYGVEGTLRAFERDYDRFRDVDTAILAITADSIFTNDAFSRSLGGLRFPILADYLPRGAVSRAWNAWVEDREHPSNVTCIVDKAGIVRFVEHHKQGGQPDTRVLLRTIASL